MGLYVTEGDRERLCQTEDTWFVPLLANLVCFTGEKKQY